VISERPVHHQTAGFPAFFISTDSGGESRLSAGLSPQVFAHFCDPRRFLNQRLGNPIGNHRGSGERRF